MKIARVFPRRTKATPTDELAFVGSPGLFPPEVDEVHISVTFTWDLAEAERLAKEWAAVAPVKIGGPATGMRGEQFTPGMYLKPGYIITSRGCPNHCWFCSVPKREGNIREIGIKPGWNILDDNILACSREHFRLVCLMLDHQKRRSEFTGGLEAARLTAWHIDILLEIKPKQLFFAYDTPDDYEPLKNAGTALIAAGLTKQSHRLRCYVLIGYPKDTFEKAEKRLLSTVDIGFMPMAMLWSENKGIAWKRFQRRWANPYLINMALPSGNRPDGFREL
jgi:hypothetical protein